MGLLRPVELATGHRCWLIFCLRRRFKKIGIQLPDGQIQSYLRSPGKNVRTLRSTPSIFVHFAVGFGGFEKANAMIVGVANEASD